MKGAVSAALVLLVLAGAVVVAFAQKAIADELERRGLIRGVWPRLRHAWFTVGSGMASVGVLWLLQTARAIDLARVQRSVVQLSLIAVGLVLAYLHRPRSGGEGDR